MSADLAKTVRSIIESHWGSSVFHDDAVLANRELGLVGDGRFDPNLNPVFFVGDISGSPRFLLIGLKPGRGLDSTPSFAAEMSALSSGFDDYWRSRLGYFGSAAFNGRHYSATAKLLSLISGEGLPSSPRDFLHTNAVQVELFPLFAAHQGFDIGGLRWLRQHTESGRLASEVLDRLLHGAEWELAVARYGSTFDFIREFFGAKDGPTLGRFPTATVVIAGKPLRLIGLTGQYVSTRDLLAVAGGGGDSGRSTDLTASETSVGVSGTFTQFRDAILALDPEVGLRPRANKSLAFDYPFGGSRRNFACITPRRGWIQLDALSSDLKFEDRIPVHAGSLSIGIARCREALRFLSP